MSSFPQTLSHYLASVKCHDPSPLPSLLEYVGSNGHLGVLPREAILGNELRCMDTVGQIVLHCINRVFVCLCLPHRAAAVPRCAEVRAGPLLLFQLAPIGRGEGAALCGRTQLPVVSQPGQHRQAGA